MVMDMKIYGPYEVWEFLSITIREKRIVKRLIFLLGKIFGNIFGKMNVKIDNKCSDTTVGPLICFLHEILWPPNAYLSHHASVNFVANLILLKLHKAM